MGGREGEKGSRERRWIPPHPCSYSWLRHWLVKSRLKSEIWMIVIGVVVVLSWWRSSRVCVVCVWTALSACHDDNGRCQHQCVDRNGTAICQCNDGYTLAYDQTSCQGDRLPHTTHTRILYCRPTMHINREIRHTDYSGPNRHHLTFLLVSCDKWMTLQFFKWFFGTL